MIFEGETINGIKVRGRSLIQILDLAFIGTKEMAEFKSTAIMGKWGEGVNCEVSYDMIVEDTKNVKPETIKFIKEPSDG